MATNLTTSLNIDGTTYDLGDAELRTPTYTNIAPNVTASSGVNLRTAVVQQMGRLCVLSLQFDITSAKSNGDQLLSGISPTAVQQAFAATGNAANTSMIYLRADNKVYAASAIPTGTWYSATLIYIATA